MTLKPSHSSIAPLAEAVFQRLARQFPVCMASDEFHFFPQVRADQSEADVWDDFSPDALQALDRELALWLGQLDDMETQPVTQDDRIDADTLKTALTTLREQLTDVGMHRTQPTWYLTILGIGLAESVSGKPGEFEDRLRNLPRFLDQARQNLPRIPRLYRDLGCEMVRELLPWLQNLPTAKRLRTASAESLSAFGRHLETIPVTEDFLPERDLYERIAHRHMRCAMSTDDIRQAQADEIQETRSRLIDLSRRLAPGSSWQEAVASLPTATPSPAGISVLYQEAITDLAAHCADLGLVTPAFLERCPVRVEPIPDFMQPVRSNAAYSMTAGHPPRGGTFYIMEAARKSAAPVDYRLLTAHETFPGHHLLDNRRWEQARPVRRHVEYPLFYEGWASFSEELLFATGYFHTPTDHLLMAKRRFWRALRGRVDLEIHTRRRSLDQAAALMTANGLPAKQANAMVRRYVLKPGYQLAYTMGRRRFKRLYDRCGKSPSSPAEFAARILSVGEIPFHHLEAALPPSGLS